MTSQEFEQKYLTHLNDCQNQAVKSVEGAVLLLAVPGSGKTTVLLYRLGYMILCLGIPPEQILTVTYTVAATMEMKSRFAALFGQALAERVEFRTINGICQTVIDSYAARRNREKPELLAESEAPKLISGIYTSLFDEAPAENTLRDLLTSISYIKNQMLGDEEIKKAAFATEKTAEIYDCYRRELSRRKKMDFDDQLTFTFHILRKCPDISEVFSKKYRYLCVDEAQDTSKIQHEILRLLSRDSGNLFMVGDEDQSIYGFRAAYPEALMSFERDHENAAVLLMEDNYRSTARILRCAEDFVCRNRDRRPKHLRPHREEGTVPTVIKIENHRSLLAYLFSLAKDCPEDTAFLFRQNDSALPLIDLLERNRIPFRNRCADGGFFRHRITLDVTDIIRFAYDQTDTERFLRIYYKLGCRITKQAALRACEQSRKNGEAIPSLLLSDSELGQFGKAAVAQMISRLAALKTDTAEEAVYRVFFGLHYQEFVQERHLDGTKYEIMATLARQEKSALSLLDRFEYLRGILTRHTDDADSSFTLSTLHKSKGLEYGTVYLADAFDGILPTKTEQQIKSDAEQKEYQEERRLFYVGMTRAKDRLYMFDCSDRPASFVSEAERYLPKAVRRADDLFDSTAVNRCGKSYRHKEKGEGRIVADDGERLLVSFPDRSSLFADFGTLYSQRDRTVTYTRPNPTDIEPTPTVTAGKRNVPDLTAVKVGTEVLHRSFGYGTVTALHEGIAEIDFDTQGKKQIRLQTVIENHLLSLLP